MSKASESSKKPIDLSLYVYRGILIPYNSDIKILLTPIYYDSKFISISRINSPLVKEGSAVNYRNIPVTFNITN